MQLNILEACVLTLFPILNMNNLFFYVYVEAVSKALTQYTFLAPWLGSYTGMETTPYLDTVANPHLAAAFPELAQYPQGMYPHSPPILSMNSLFFYVYVEAVSKALSQYTFLAPWLDSHAGMDPNPYSEVAGWNSPQVDRFAKLLLFPSDHCQDDTKRN
jgi:hypothetical protein